MRRLLALLAALLIASPAFAQSTGGGSGGGGGGGGSGTVTSVVCPSATISTSGTCSPLSVTGTSGHVITASGTNLIGDSGTALSALAPLASPTFTGTITTPITGGGTQCLQVSNTGVVSGTAATCGGGAGSLTITDGTHSVAATTQLTVTGGTVGGTTPNATLSISGGGGTGATLQTASGGGMAGTAPTSSSTATMAGFAQSITPTTTGRILVIWTGAVSNAADVTLAHGIRWQPYFGTGTAPTTNAALTGTAAAQQQTFLAGTAPTATDLEYGFTATAIITGLALGTPVWLDLSQVGVSNTVYKFANVGISVIEF